MVFPVLLLLYLVPVIYTRVLRYTNHNDYKTYLAQVEILKASRTPGPDSLRKKISNKSTKDKNQDTITRFKAYKKPQEPGINLVDFSETDSIVLQVVPGIGEVLAGRIIKYRESLGGLHQKQQLLEVYGVTEEVADRIIEYFPFTPTIQQKLRINDVEAAELAEHPYINYGQAKVIIAYRKQHGNYKSAEDLLKIKIFNEEWLSRLRPYLAFEEE